jgi:hypothetical protein
MRALWLPDVLRDAGLRVRVEPGWERRGGEMRAINALVGHDTVAGQDVARNRALLRDGRPDLPGPLSQLGGEPDGMVNVIAAGRAHHNGYGRYGNDALGWEVYCYGGLKGREQPWNAAQYESFVIGARAICDHLSLDVARVLGHKESDPSRKIDPYGVSMAQVRTDIANRKVQIASANEEDDMYAVPIDLAPDQSARLSVEPAQGFFGRTESLLLLDALPGQDTHAWVWAERGHRGAVDVVGGRRWVTRVDGGVVDVRNDGERHLFGALLVKRVAA